MATEVIGSKMPTFASDALKPSKEGFGQNGFAGASSDLPGERTRAGLTVNNDDTDPVLDAVKKFGTAAMRAPEVGDSVEDICGTPATQIRDIAAKNVPDHPAMASARSRQPTK